FFFWPIPPPLCQQRRNSFIRKAFSDRFSRNTTHNGIGWDIFCYNGPGANNGTIPYGNSSKDHGLISNPNITSNNNIAFVVPCLSYVANIKPPFLKEDRKWISRK